MYSANEWDEYSLQNATLLATIIPSLVSTDEPIYQCTFILGPHKININFLRVKYRTHSPRAPVQPRMIFLSVSIIYIFEKI